MSKLEDVFVLIRNGASIKQGDSAEGFPITRIETIANEVIDRNRMGYAGITELEKYSDYVLKTGDILMSHINSEKHLGKTAIYKNCNNEIIIHGMNLLMLRPNEKVLFPKYVSYYFKSAKFKRQIPNITKKSVNQASFTVTDLKELRISIPPIEEQKKIAEILDKASNLISLRKKQIKKMDLLVKARFIEMFGNPVLNSRGWKIKDINSISELIVDCAHSTPKYCSENTGYMCIRTTILKPNYINWNEVEYISEAEYNARTKRYVPKEGDIVYSREGAILGIASMIDRKGHIALGQRIMLISVSDSIINPRFLCFSMNSEGVLEQVKNLIGGSASPHINVSDVKRMTIMYPPIALQNQFADFVQQVDKQKAQLKQGLERLELTYKALMQQYFN